MTLFLTGMYEAKNIHLIFRFYGMQFQIAPNYRAETRTIHVDLTLKGKNADFIYKELYETNNIVARCKSENIIIPRTFNFGEQDRTLYAEMHIENWHNSADWSAQFDWITEKMCILYEIFGDDISSGFADRGERPRLT